MSLAEDLVTAAAEAIDSRMWELNDPGLNGNWSSSPGDFTDEARAAVVAVLRRLVEEERDWREYQLAVLADEIAIRAALADEIKGDSRG